jgi:sugar phosphate isomerase/epimerase
MIEEGFKDFARRWGPIFDQYKSLGVRFCLEVHPTEIAFDIVTARKRLKPSIIILLSDLIMTPVTLGYQGVDYVKFIYEFADRIFHVHMKDVHWNEVPGDIGVLEGIPNSVITAGTGISGV